MVKARHGHTRGNKRSPTHESWHAMIARCNNPNHIGYQYYGAKGVTVCDRWLQFENFLDDMGERPDGLTLDRKKSHLGYSKGNCRWATPKEQSRQNRTMVTFDGKTLSLSEWASYVGISLSSFSKRLAKWSIKAAILTPKKGK